MRMTGTVSDSNRVRHGQQNMPVPPLALQLRDLQCTRLAAMDNLHNLLLHGFLSCIP